MQAFSAEAPPADRRKGKEMRSQVKILTGDSVLRGDAGSGLSRGYKSVRSGHHGRDDGGCEKRCSPVSSRARRGGALNDDKGELGRLSPRIRAKTTLGLSPLGILSLPTDSAPRLVGIDSLIMFVPSRLIFMHHTTNIPPPTHDHTVIVGACGRRLCVSHLRIAVSNPMLCFAPPSDRRSCRDRLCHDPRPCYFLGS